MSLFRKRVDTLPQQTAVAGTTLRWEIPRDFHIDTIFLHVRLVQTAAATVVADGVFNALKRVTLNVSDGARTRNVVDCSGMALIEYARMVCGGLGHSLQSGLSNSTNNLAQTYDFIVPIFFAHPQIADPLSSMLLLPAPRFNSNPVLTVSLSTQAEMDTNASKTWAISAASFVKPVIVRREVTIPNWRTFDTEQTEVTLTTGATGRQVHELQVPGSYTALLLRGYNSTTARINPTTADSDVRLQALGQVFRKQTFDEIFAENEMSLFGPAYFSGAAPATYSPAAYYAMFDFLTDRVGESVAELGSVFDTNQYMATGARPQLEIDWASTAYRIQMFSHRIYGVLDDLKLTAAGAAK